MAAWQCAHLVFSFRVAPRHNEADGLRRGVAQGQTVQWVAWREDWQRTRLLIVWVKLSILVLAKDAKLPLLRPQLLLPVDVFGTFLALLLLLLLT